MRKEVAIPLILTLCLSTTGCAYKFYHPYKDEAALAQDKRQCEKEGTAAYPVLMVQRLVSPAYQGPSTTSCQQYGSNMQCTTTPGQYYPATYTTDDVNYQSRKDTALECLKALGWSRQPIKQSDK
jgi:hypothetical protein